MSGPTPVDSPYTGTTGAVSITLSRYGDVTAAQSPGPVPGLRPLVQHAVEQRLRSRAQLQHVLGLRPRLD